MKVRYKAFSMKKKGKDYSVKSKMYDITKYCSSVTWSGSKSEIARKLELQIINPANDSHIKTITLKLGSMLFLYGDDKKELFRGYIIERERTSKETVSYIAYDLCFYLLKSSATYKFKKKMPEEIAKMVCDDIGVKTGKLAKTEKKYKLLMKNRTIYQIIMAGYTKAYKSTGTKYHLYSEKGKICVRKIGNDWYDTLITEKSNILSVSNKESIADVVNRVKIYDGKNKLVKVVKQKKSIAKYGVFQHVYTAEKKKSPVNSAKAMFRDPTRTMELELVGDDACVTGKCVKVKSAGSGIKGRFYVESDAHSWKDGIHTMKITLSFENEMDTQAADKASKSTDAQADPSTGTAEGTDTGTAAETGTDTGAGSASGNEWGDAGGSTGTGGAGTASETEASGTEASGTEASGTETTGAGTGMGDAGGGTISAGG